jgi:hypothetical protein
MSFGFKHDLFSFAVMIIFVFHAKNSAFSKCFPKEGKEQNHSAAPPLSTLLEVRYMPLYAHPLRPGKGV